MGVAAPRNPIAADAQVAGLNPEAPQDRPARTQFAAGAKREPTMKRRGPEFCTGSRLQRLRRESGKSSAKGNPIGGGELDADVESSCEFRQDPFLEKQGSTERNTQVLRFEERRRLAIRMLVPCWRFRRRLRLGHAGRAVLSVLRRLRDELAIYQQGDGELQGLVEPRTERAFGDELPLTERSFRTLIAELYQRTPTVPLPLDEYVQEKLAGRRGDRMTAEVAVHGARESLASETSHLSARSRPREFYGGSIVGSERGSAAKHARNRKLNTRRDRYSATRGPMNMHAQSERSRARLRFST